MPTSSKRQSLLDMSGKSGVGEKPPDVLPWPVRPVAIRMLWSALLVIVCCLTAIVWLVGSAV